MNTHPEGVSQASYVEERHPGPREERAKLRSTELRSHEHARARAHTHTHTHTHELPPRQGRERSTGAATRLPGPSLHAAAPLTPPHGKSRDLGLQGRERVDPGTQKGPTPGQPGENSDSNSWRLPKWCPRSTQTSDGSNSITAHPGCLQRNHTGLTLPHRAVSGRGRAAEAGAIDELRETKVPRP